MSYMDVGSAVLFEVRAHDSVVSHLLNYFTWFLLSTCFLLVLFLSGMKPVSRNLLKIL